MTTIQKQPQAASSEKSKVDLGAEKHQEHHSHSHNHAHGSGHHHHHGVSERMGLAFFLNLSFALVELVGGLLTNSLAILSDAFHDFGDAAAIGMAWYLEKKSLKKSSLGFSYGYRRLSVLGAFFTGIILVVGSGAVIVHAIPRLFDPQPVHVPGMIGLALLGVAVNGFAAFRMAKGESLNEKMILWHLLEDVLGWILILFGAVLMLFFDLPMLDPIMAIAVAAWVLWNVVLNLKRTLKVFLQASPDQFQTEQVSEYIKAIPGVLNIHHVHIWSLDGIHHILTSHIQFSSEVTVEKAHEIKAEIKKQLFELFHITESTIETEWAGQECADPHHD